MNKQEVEDHINDIGSRLAAIEQQSSASDKASAFLLETNVKLAKIEETFRWVTLVFVVLGGIAVWNIIKYSEFEANRDKSYTLLVNQLRDQTSRAINSMTITANTSDQKDRVNDLVRTKQSLIMTGVNTEQFRGTALLIEALELMIVDEKPDKASESLEKLESRYEPYVRSRAITLRTAITIAQHRGNFPPELKQRLLNALALDHAVGLAYNGVGIAATNQATKKIKEVGKWISEEEQNKLLRQAQDLINEADNAYRLASDLDGSALGRYRYVNNRIWSRLLLFKAHMDHRKPLLEILSYMKAANVDEFFTDIRQQLAAYKEISPRLPVATETEAQSLCVKAQYERTNSSTEWTKTLKAAMELFTQAIRDQDLYLWEKTEAGAIDSFDRDPLHTMILENDNYKAMIHDEIRKWFEKRGH